MTNTCVTVFCKSVSNRLFLTMDTYQLHRAKLSRLRTSWVCGLHGWKSSSSNLPVAVKRLYSFNENVKASFARLPFFKGWRIPWLSKDSKSHTGKRLPVLWRCLESVQPNPAVSLGPSYGSWCGPKPIHMVICTRKIFSVQSSNGKPPQIEGKWLFTFCRHFWKARNILQVLYTQKGTKRGKPWCAIFSFP